MSDARPRLTLLGREGCQLCEEMHIALIEHFGAGAFVVTPADVDSREDWRRRYGLKIPVLLDDAGTPVCSVHLDTDALHSLLVASTPLSQRTGP